MKKIIIIVILVITGLTAYNQTYNPALHTVTNKPIGIAQAVPTDARSYYYDASLFIYREYQSTAEVLTYLNLAKYRTGQFFMFVNVGGTLNPDGTFTGGTTVLYIFRDGTADINLVNFYSVVAAATTGSGMNYNASTGSNDLGGIITTDPSEIFPSSPLKKGFIKNGTLTQVGNGPVILIQEAISSLNNKPVNFPSPLISNLTSVYNHVSPTNDTINNRFMAGAGKFTTQWNITVPGDSPAYIYDSLNNGVTVTGVLSSNEYNLFDSGTQWVNHFHRIYAYYAEPHVTLHGYFRNYSLLGSGAIITAGSNAHADSAGLMITSQHNLFPTVSRGFGLGIFDHRDIMDIYSDTILFHNTPAGTAVSILGLDAGHKVITTSSSGLTPDLQAVTGVGNNTTLGITAANFTGNWFNFLPNATTIPLPPTGNSIADSAGINYIGANGNGIRLSKSLIPALQRRVFSFPNEDGTFIMNADTSGMLNPYLRSVVAAATYATTSSLTTYVPTSRTINGADLTANRTINISRGTNSWPLTVTGGSTTNVVVDFDTNYVYRDADLAVKRTSFYNPALDIIENIVKGGATILGVNHDLADSIVMPPGFAWFDIALSKGPTLNYKTSVDNINAFRSKYMVKGDGTYIKTYYVSPESGNDAWPGTADSAFKTCAQAESKSDMLYEILLPGVYGNAEKPKGTQTHPINIICSQDAHIGDFLTFNTWAADITYTNLFLVKTSSIPNKLFDRNARSRLNGAYGEIPLANSLLDCSRRLRTYWTSNDTVWVNYSVLPQKNYDNLLFDFVGRVNFTNITRDDSIYVEGPKMYATGLFQSSGTVGVVPFAAQRDIDYITGSGTFDVVSDKGYSMTSMNFRLWKVGTSDGMNYHQQGNQGPGDTLKIVEINGVSYDTVKQRNNDQSSTAHNHSKVVRVNDNFTDAGAQVIHDIDTSLCASFGCRYMSITYNVLGGAALRASGLTKHYVDNCEIGGFAPNDLYVEGGGIIYIKGTPFRTPHIDDASSHIYKNPY